MKPVKGQDIYVPTSLHVYRGKDDFIGGLATISEVIINPKLPEGHVNQIMIKIEEEPNTQYNWKLLLEKQERLKERFGDKRAHPDPELREQFNQPDKDWK